MPTTRHTASLVAYGHATAHKVAASIQAGTIWVNCYGALDLNVGFGGFKMSGYGWKGQEHVQSFLYQKAVYMNLG